MEKDTIDTATSVLTQKELDAFCKKWHIPANVEPQLSGPNDTIRDTAQGKIVMDGCLLKSSSVVPISVLWFEGSSVDKDLPHSDDIVNLELMDVLNKHRLVFRKYPKTLLNVVGLSRVYDETDVRPTFLGSGDKDRCLFSSDPFEVKVGERTLSEGEVSLLTITDELRDASARNKKKRFAFDISLPPVKKAKGSSFAPPPPKKNPSTAGKTPVAMQKLVTLGAFDVASCTTKVLQPS
ncbi:hypothetical protein Tco_0819179 [Tanacetum coccineum]|uniref:Uncharacterized protein n=1 Tax=Tanacetum coccineum TaxID=301880 RepID=A0ABQ5A5T9_9ASTR